jgi:hypothetical protein
MLSEVLDPSRKSLPIEPTLYVIPFIVLLRSAL